jgi:release factor glutamine methyltransferase
MTILDWLHDNMVRLQKAGVDSPRRDSLVFLEDTLKKDRAWVLAHPEHDLESQILEKLRNLIERRIRREPLAYIRGKAWFYGRFFNVSPAVMIPRPESESFIEILKKLKPGRIIDIGTGSGCLAITAKLELPEAKVTAVDSSETALKIASLNAKKHSTNIKLLKSDLLEGLTVAEFQPSAAVIANLPYVPEGLITSPEITHEPSEALFSGKDGLDHYRKFWQQIDELPKAPEHVLTESLESQHKELTKLAEKAGYKLQNTQGLIQLYRLPAN